MKNNERVKYYPLAEEQINVLSHGLGLLLSGVALFLLVKQAVSIGTIWHTVSFTIYGVSLVLLYAASTIYHSSQRPLLRSRLNVFDHSAIYVLIAGTYTPLTLVTLHGTMGWVLFGIAWGAALTGIVLKLFFMGKFKLLSTLMYVAMGWIIVIAVKPLMQNLPVEGLWWLLAGGVSYTVGAVLYSLKRMKFNHAVFHVFVLIGSFCHFMTIYFYV